MASPGKLTFGSYEVLQNPDGSPCLLGQGSFGVTYKARHVLLGRVTALKVIREDLLNRGSKEDQEETNRFVSEARAVGRLHHPGIAMVHDCALDNGVFYYAMEYCDGGTLQDGCEKNGPLPWSEVRRIALQMASALDYAHASGFLHRDIKPANIMLNGKGKARQAKLIDFGLAKKFLPDAETSEATVRHDQENFRGNFATASPEQILEKPLDPRSDLFSFGVTLWWLLIGKNPFADMKRGPLIADRVGPSSYASSLPADLPAEARDLLTGLLEKDADKRIASAHLVVERLSTAATATAAVAAEPVASPTVALEPLPGPPDLEEDYAIGGVLATASQAKLYTGESLATHQAVIVIIPDRSLDPVARGGMRVAASRQLDFGAYAFHDWRTSSGDDVFIISKPEGCSLMAILRQFGPARFADALPFLSHLARCFDASHVWTTFGIRVDPGDVHVRARDGGADLDRFQSWLDLDPLATRSLPFFSSGADHTGSSEATLSTSAQEFPPLAQFAALVYRVLAGSAVRYAAFFTASGYVMASGLSEDGNALLADTICTPESQPSACRLIQLLASLESLPVAELTPLVDPPSTQDIAIGKLVPTPSPFSAARVVAGGPLPGGAKPAPLDNSVSVNDKVAELERQLAIAKRAAEEEARREAEQHARRAAEAQQAAEQEARRKDEAAKLQAAENMARQAAAGEEARRKQEEAKRLAEEQARQSAEAKRAAEHEARLKQEEAKRMQEEARLQQAENLARQADAAKLAAEEARRNQAALRLADEQARITAEAKRLAELKERRKQEEETKRLQAEAKQAAEDEARRKQEEAKRLAAEEKARLKAQANQRTNPSAGAPPSTPTSAREAARSKRKILPIAAVLVVLSTTIAGFVMYSGGNGKKIGANNPASLAPVKSGTARDDKKIETTPPSKTPPPDANPPALPTPENQASLVKQSMRAFQTSAKNNTPEDFRKLWKNKLSSQQEAQLTSLLKNKPPIPPNLEQTEPTIKYATVLDEAQALVLNGSYKTSPSPVRFEHKYIYEDPKWMLTNFVVAVDPPPLPTDSKVRIALDPKAKDRYTFTVKELDEKGSPLDGGAKFEGPKAKEAFEAKPASRWKVTLLGTLDEEDDVTLATVTLVLPKSCEPNRIDVVLPPLGEIQIVNKYDNADYTGVKIAGPKTQADQPVDLTNPESRKISTAMLIPAKALLNQSTQPFPEKDKPLRVPVAGRGPWNITYTGSRLGNKTLQSITAVGNAVTQKIDTPSPFSGTYSLITPMTRFPDDPGKNPDLKTIKDDPHKVGEYYEVDYFNEMVYIDKDDGPKKVRSYFKNCFPLEALPHFLCVFMKLDLKNNDIPNIGSMAILVTYSHGTFIQYRGDMESPKNETADTIIFKYKSHKDFVGDKDNPSIAAWDKEYITKISAQKPVDLHHFMQTSLSDWVDYQSLENSVYEKKSILDFKTWTERTNEEEFRFRTEIPRRQC